MIIADADACMQRAPCVAMAIAFESIGVYAGAKAEEPVGVDVYGLRLDAIHPRTDVFETALTAADYQHLGRMPTAEQRRRAATTRGAFRMLLAAYTGVEPAELPLLRDEFGKPYLRSAPGEAPLYANCSRSDGLAVFAVTRLGPIGVDVEVVTPARFSDRIAQVMLSRAEREVYAALPIYARERWLAHVWVCKEAILKGIGCGLQIDPAFIESPAHTGRTALPAGSRGLHAVPYQREWSLSELEWDRGVFAVAVRGKAAAVRFVELVQGVRVPGPAWHDS